MTNKEKYQRAFSTLHASNRVMEEKAMEKTRRIYLPKLVAVAAVVVLVLALASIAYAADVGGIQRSVQLWIHGDQTDAVLDIQQGEHTEYTVTYEDAEGNAHEFGGGGVAYDWFGRERALTEAEILELLDHPDVEYEDDGSVWVYYHGQKIEITDKFDEDGVCYVHLVDGDDSLYMTLKYDDGYATSPHSYPDPRSFN